ncbi:MAG: hypothetical protein CML93_00235 [Rhodobiaceae bacterium]|nr:hypothetical protein [Rhodobiaceae bacterium]
MDEFGSPIVGGIRAVRRTVSSSVFNPVSRPAQEQQSDPVTNNLLTQNSITLNNVSQRLEDISKQIGSLNFSLAGIKENLAISDQLEKQRETAKQNREAILAEQGLRKGKESALEQKIQSSLQKPLQGIAAKTQKSLFSLQNFFLILAGGWLTNVGIDLIQSIAEGNIEKIEKLKRIFTLGLVGLGATFTAFNIGILTTLRLLTGFASTVGRVAFGGFLRSTLGGVKRLFAAGVKAFRPLIPIVVALGGGVLGKLLAILGLGAAGGVAVTQGGRVIDKKISDLGSRVTVDGSQRLLDEGRRKINKRGTGFLNINPSKTLPPPKGINRVLQSPFGKIKPPRGAGGIGIGGALFNVVFDLISGVPLDEALANLAGYAAGFALAAKVFAPLLIAPFPGARPLYFLLTLGGGILGESAVNSVFNGIKGLFGFGKKDKAENTELSVLTEDDLVLGSESVNVEPVQNDNLARAEIISNNPEDVPSILNFPVQGAATGGQNNAPVDIASNELPTIYFDDSNTAALFATATFGAPA